MTTALYPILAQPPHMGHIGAAINALEEADHVIFCIRETNLSVNYKSMMATLKLIEKITDKFSVVSHPADFDMITHLPDDLPLFDYLIVTSNDTYVHLLSCGIENIRLIPKLLGYEDVYMLHAFTQGLALDSLRLNSVVHVGIDKDIKEK